MRNHVAHVRIGYHCREVLKMVMKQANRRYLVTIFEDYVWKSMYDDVMRLVGGTTKQTCIPRVVTNDVPLILSQCVGKDHGDDNNNNNNGGLSKMHLKNATEKETYTLRSVNGELEKANDTMNSNGTIHLQTAGAISNAHNVNAKHKVANGNMTHLSRASISSSMNATSGREESITPVVSPQTRLQLLKQKTFRQNMDEVNGSPSQRQRRQQQQQQCGDVVDVDADDPSPREYKRSHTIKSTPSPPQISLPFVFSTPNDKQHELDNSPEGGSPLASSADVTQDALMTAKSQTFSEQYRQTSLSDHHPKVLRRNKKRSSREDINYSFSPDPLHGSAEWNGKGSMQWKSGNDNDEGVGRENGRHMRRMPLLLLQQSANGRLGYPATLERDSSQTKMRRESIKTNTTDGVCPMEEVEGSVIIASVSNMENLEDHIEQAMTGREIQFSPTAVNHNANSSAYSLSSNNASNNNNNSDIDYCISPKEISSKDVKVLLPEEYTLYLSHIYDLLLTLIRMHHARDKEHLNHNPIVTFFAKWSPKNEYVSNVEEDKQLLLLDWCSDQCPNPFHLDNSLRLISCFQLFDYSDYVVQLPQWYHLLLTFLFFFFFFYYNFVCNRYSSFIMSVCELLLKLTKKSEPKWSELMAKHDMLQLLCVDILGQYHYDVDVVSLVFNVLRQIVRNEDWTYLLLAPKYFDGVMRICEPWWHKCTTSPSMAQMKAEGVQSSMDDSQTFIYARKLFHTQVAIFKFFVDLSKTNPFDLLEHDIMNKVQSFFIFIFIVYFIS
ncbi:hypothetical protein RFI_18213 [Reticulomyxa filosa]|uniref:Uncharacterized protein n=1 Tax=Reticulomyxa filosa TaxID=46433 RepID=X6N120_RETFI|nr:hypothetical protein RFI_18213 [Reticulomyxa filosa]|eukprot:ETO19022.1 hypothetical protein RFI_18213 [Reticulomyxa filosa]